VEQTDRFCLHSSTNYYLLSCQSFSIQRFHPTHLRTSAAQTLSRLLTSCHSCQLSPSTVHDLTRRHQTRRLSEDISNHPDSGHRQPQRGGSAESTLGVGGHFVGEGLCPNVRYWVLSETDNLQENRPKTIHFLFSKCPHRTVEIVKTLQNHINPKFFSPCCVYDGTVILYSLRELPLVGGDTRTVNIQVVYA
jgi:hypothetical protein